MENKSSNSGLPHEMPDYTVKGYDVPYSKTEEVNIIIKKALSFKTSMDELLKRNFNYQINIITIIPFSRTFFVYKVTLVLI